MEKIKLLFVEDDASFASIVKGCLELTGLYQVETVSDRKEGLEVFYSSSPNVVVADITMPVLDGNSVYIGNMIFDTDKQYLQYENKKYKLSARETRILHKLYINKGYVVKRDELLKEIWGTSDFFTSRSLDVFVNSLRKRLSLDPKINIETIRGKGLVLNII